MKIPLSLLTTAASPPSFNYNSFGPPIKSKHGHPPQTRQNRLYHHRHLPSTWSWARCLGIRDRVNSNWPEPVWDRTRASLPSSSTGILCFWTLGHPKERTHLFFTTWLSHECRQIHGYLTYNTLCLALPTYCPKLLHRERERESVKNILVIRMNLLNSWNLAESGEEATVTASSEKLSHISRTLPTRILNPNPKMDKELIKIWLSQKANQTR